MGRQLLGRSDRVVPKGCGPVTFAGALLTAKPTGRLGIADRAAAVSDVEKGSCSDAETHIEREILQRRSVGS